MCFRDVFRSVPPFSTILTLALLLFSTSCAQQVTVPSFFADGMVIQRNVPVPVWGFAEGDGEVTVAINGQTATAEVADDGTWMVELAAMPAGGPYELTIEGTNTITISDVLVGEVWIASGQSNMQWTVANSNDAAEEIEAADYPNIRMFTVERSVADEPQADVVGTWKPALSEYVGGFSAAGYFFARYLYKELNVPIGIIHTSWGGTPAEAWTSYQTLEEHPHFQPIIERWNKDIENYDELMEEWREKVRQIEEEGVELPPYQVDAGNKGSEEGWQMPDYDTGDWNTMTLPRYWETNDDFNIDGAIWFRKTVDIPEAWNDDELTLSLGPIDDFDITYFNGVEVGSTGKETPNFYMHPREYAVPAELVQQGENVIAVRAFDHYGNGGFAGNSTQMYVGRGEEQINIAGDWLYKIEQRLLPSGVTGPGGGNLPPEPRGPGHPHTPAGLFNAMIYPLAPYAVQGAIWYQGEANAGRAYQYRELLPAMISDWRGLWGQGDFPFGIVQLANFMSVLDEPSESEWAELREAQAMTAGNLPNTGLAVIIDIGEADDIHPRNKQDVGKRLALWALDETYGKDLLSSGPTLKAVQKTDDGKLVLTFDNVGDGLEVHGDELKGFAVSGENGRFEWALAEVTGKNQVTVQADEIEDPEYVRYAWASNPVCNLYNSEGLPAHPFRTDELPGATAEIY